MIDFTQYEQLEAFVYLHQEIRTKEEAKLVIDTLLPLKEQWQDYYMDKMRGERELFVNIHWRLYEALTGLKEDNAAIQVLKDCLTVVENSDSYKYLYSIKSDLYFELAKALCFQNEDNSAVECLRNSIYYNLTGYNHKHYNNFEFFSFRQVTNYLISSLKQDVITLTDPAEFNDPVDPALLAHFDFKILQTDNERERRFLQLQRQVYGEVKIRCFTRMLPLPKKEGRDVNPLNDEEKEINITTMWAHYADYHKGICIKYVLPMKLTELEFDEESVRILGPVSYVDAYSPQSDSYNIHDAFFVKSKLWEYEHEDRILYFNRHKREKYASVKIPKDCIKEIYIGLRTSEEDQWDIKQAIKDKPDIKVYQMVLSAENVFLLKAIPVDRNNWLKDYKEHTPCIIKSYICKKVSVWCKK